MGSLGQDKCSQHLLMASMPAGYSVEKYFKYVPKNVIASNVHQTAYWNKRKVAQPTLTMDMIADLYITFKCNMEVTHQDEYDEHTELVHGITPENLKALSTIEVDTKQAFHLQPALHIEHTSSDEQDKILNGWFTRTVGRGVIKKAQTKLILISMKAEARSFSKR